MRWKSASLATTSSAAEHHQHTALACRLQLHPQNKYASQNPQEI